ncbi:putative reverse transcriptase domain-containing protein [Tanacetum coccineum]
MLTVDFSNAFNLVDTSALPYEVRVRCPTISLWVDFLYGQTTRLYIGDTHIWSATGVQQGDPLGPLLFTLELHRLVHKIRDNCKLLFHACYLDDGTVIGDSEEVAMALDIIRGLFPVDIRRPSLGVKLLGGAASRDIYFNNGLAMRRAVNVVDLIGLLPQLHDPHRLRGSIENMVVCGWPFFGDLQWRLGSLPIRFGGLSFEMVKDMKVHFDMTVRQKAVFECLRASHAQDFLLAIPIDGLELTGFKYRHNMVRDILFDICRRAGISANKEAPVNFLIDPLDGRSTLRHLTF